MPNLFQSIALIGKHGDPNIRDTLDRLAIFLADMGREVCVEENTAQRIPGLGRPALSLEAMAGHCDLAIVVGGDGTLLHAAGRLADFDIPLLGINLGRLGFLADVPQREMTEVLRPILPEDEPAVAGWKAERASPGKPGG